MEFVESRLTAAAKELLYDELENYIFKDRKGKIDLFDKFLCLSKEETQFDGLNDIISSTLNAWAEGEVSTQDVLKSLSVTEQYIKSIIYMVNRQVYDEIMSKNESFKNAIIFIGMTKLKEPYGNLDLKLTSWEERSNMTLEEKYKDSPTQLHWAIAYAFRNEDAHSCRKYGISKSLSQILSILFVLIESTWKYKSRIEALYTEHTIFNGINKKDYYSRIIKEYESKNCQKTFVLMNGSKVDPLSSLFSFDKDEEEEACNLETCLDIMKMVNEDSNYIKLIGEAGLGKSRVMKHLQYNDAKEGIAFPVYVELKELSDFKSSIMELIAEKAGLDDKACVLLMKSGGMRLYLDGVNEMLCSDKNKRILCSQIDELAVKYPKTIILVSDRECSQVSVRMDIPTFLICKLDKDMINEFIHKNSESKEYEDRAYKVLEENNYLYNIVKTPFMLGTFIGLVEHGGYKKRITNESQLIEVFVKSLIYREAYEKKEVRADKIEMLLTYLLVGQKSLEDRRFSCGKEVVLARFRKCKEYYGFEIDTDEIFEIIVQMGFLEKVQGDERYTFTNEFYENYFFNKAFSWVEE